MYLVFAGVAAAQAPLAANWSVQTSGVTQMIENVHFVDANTGWFVGYAGMVRKTTNGGTTWTAQSPGTSDTLYGLSFVDSNTGWASGTYGVLRKTTDGGANWTSQTASTGAHGWGVFARTATTAWQVGSSGMVGRTTNGTTWSGSEGNPAGNPGYGLNDIQFVDANNGYFVAGGGNCGKSIDGGATWANMASAVTNSGPHFNPQLLSLSFVSVSTGWAVGDNGTIIKTTDGGTTWTSQTTGTTESFTAVSFVDANTGWAVGNNGLIMSTTNGGTTWTTVGSGTTAYFSDVHFIDADHGWVVGQDGTVLKYSTGAAPPVAPAVTSSTTDLAGNATTLTITGSDFDPVAANNTVTFNNGTVGTVTAATATQLTVALTTLPTATGSLTATVTTNSVSSGSAVQVATVTSAYVVGTASLLHGPAAGSGSVILGTFPASSSWSAVANDSWLHLDGANSSGSGSKTIVFTFDANTGATRTGTLTIAGQTVTVTQAGTTYQAASPVTALVSSGLNGATRVATDATGANVYFTDGGNSAVKRWSRLSGTTTTVFGAGQGLGNPQALALDASGNIYVGDHADDTVKKWNGTTLTTVASVTDPNCLAVDTRGDVYIADASSVKKLTTATGVVTTLVSGIFCQGVGVDRALNVYFTTNFPTSLRKRNAADGSVVTLIPSGLLNPQGPVVDGSGNVFMPDPSASTLHRYTAATGAVSTQTSLSLLGAAVDGTGNVYLADGGTGIYEIPLAFVDPTTRNVAAAGGTLTLADVLPSTVDLTGPFAPTSDQPFATLNSAVAGVVTYNVAANTGAPRSATLSVLGKSITLNQTGVPAVSLPTSADVATSSATLGGTVTSDGGSTITERGVVYSITTINSNPLIGGLGVTKVTASGTTGLFTAPVTVAAGAGYSFKAYATNAGGTSYSSVATFTSLADFEPTPGSPITYSGVISGSATVTNSGDGTLNLTGANTYTGPTNIESGTVSINTVSTGTNAQSLGAGNTINLGVTGVSSGSLTYTGGAGTLDKNINSLGTGSDTVQNGGSGLLTLSGTLNKTGTTLTLQGGANGITVSGSIIGNTGSPDSDLIVDGGTTTLTGANTYNGPTHIINGGTLNANAADALPTTPARSDILIDQSGSGTSTLALGVSQSVLSLTGASTSLINLNANTLTVGAASGTTTFAGVISGSGGLTKDNASTLILTGTNTYSGATTVSGGTLQIGNGGTTGSLAGTSNITNNAALIFSRSDTLTQGTNFGTVLGGTGTVEKSGSGMLILNGANTYSGQTTVSTGVLSVRSASALGTAAAGTVVSSGAAMQIQGGITVASEALTLNGLGEGGANGALRNMTGHNVYGGVITLGSASRINSDSFSLTLNNNITGAGFGLTVGGSGSVSISGNITTGAGTLSKDGSGTLTLSGTNSYTGLTTVGVGIVNIQSSAALGTTGGGTSVTNGATLQLQGGITVGAEALTLNGGNAAGQTGALVNVSGTNTYGGAITIAASSSVSAASGSVLNLTGGLVKNGTTLTFNGGGTINVSTVGISGASANSDLVVDGTTVNLDVASSYNGPTFIRNSGTLNANVAGALPTATRSAVTFDGTGTSVLTLGANQVAASLASAGAATITLNANTITLGDASSNTTFAGSIGGTGGLTKDGASTQVLSGSNGYSGTTTVSAGVLSITGNINSSATLTISGGQLTTSGADKLANSAAVGISGGTLTIGGNDTVGTLTMSSGTIGGSSTLTATTYGLSGGTVDGNLGTGTLNSSGTVALNGTAGATAVNITAGTLTLGSSDRLANGATVTVSGGTLALGSNNDTVSIYNMSSGSLTGTGTLTATTYGLSGGTVDGNFGTGTINSSGTVALNGTAGATAVNVTAGTLTLGSADRLADGATVTVSGGILAIGTNTDTVSIFNMSSGSLTGTGTLTATTYGLSGGTVTANLGTGTLNSSGTVALNGTAGATAVNVTAGTLTLGSADRLADGATVTVSGGALALGANSDTVSIFNMSSGSITGTGTLTAATYGLSGGTVTANLGTGTLNSSGTVALNGTAGATTVNITAGTLTLGSANRLADGATVTVSGGALALGTNSDTVSIFNMSSGSITGSGTLTATTYGLSGGTVTANLGTGTLNSSGTVALNGTAGATAVNVTAGTLTLGSANRLADGATVTVSGGALALGINSDTVSIFNMSSGSLTGSGTLTATTYGLSGGTVDANLGTGTLNSSGTVALNGTAAVSTVNVTAGTLTLGASSAVNSATTVDISGGSMVLGASSQIGNSATVTVSGGTLALGTNNDSVSIFNMSSGSLTGTGTLTAITYGLSGGTVDANLGTGIINSTGTVALNGTAGASAVNVSAGTLTLGSSDRLANGATVTVSGGTLAMGSNNDTVSVYNMSSGSITGTGTLTATTYGLSGGTVDANLGTGTLNNSGTVALNGTSGATSVNITAGTLTLGSSDRLANGATVTVSGGALALGANTDTVTTFNMSSGSLTGTGTLTATTYGLSGGTVDGNLGTGTINSSGAVALNGTAGATSVNITAGTLTLGASERLANGASVLIAGGSLAIGTFNETIGSLVLATGSISGSTGVLTASSTYDVRSGTISAILGGSVGLTKTLAGTVTLSNANTYTGTTTVSAGTLALSGSGSLSDSSSLVVNGGTYDIGTVSDTVAGVQLLSGSITGTTGVLTSTSTFDVQSGSVSAILGGTVGLTKTGGGTVTLSNANTYTGTTTVSAGTLALSGSGRLSDSSSVVVNGGTFSIGSVSDTVAGVQLTSGSITGSGGVLTSSSTYDVQSGSVSAILGGSVGLTKTTAGAVTLSGTNSYTGATTLTAGSLTVNGSIATSSLTTINGGTLFGTGTVGAVLLNSAGTINAGGVASAGTLNTGNISIVDGQLHFNIGGTGSFDSLNTTGTVNLGSGAKLVLDAISGYTATLNNAFTLVSNDLADAISGAFAKGTFGGTTVVTLSGVDYVENVLGSGYYGRINYSGSSAAPGTLATTGNDIILKIVTPEITITESGNNQLDGGTYDFGEVDKVVPSVPLTKTFTIRNDGEVDLMDIVVNAPTGAAASDYTLNLTGTASTLIPGQTTTFTITFDPSRIGTRNAAITIDNNDLNENPFNLALTGVGSIARDISEPWTVRYGGVQAPATRRDSVAMAVVVQKSTTRDEAVAVFATGYTTNAALNRDIYTAKYDPVTGALLWERIYAGSAAMYDEGAAIAVDSNGDVVITGYTTVATNNSNVYTAKYSGTDGSILWERTYAGSGGTFDEGSSVAISSTGNVYVAGYGRTTATGADLFAAGYTSAGGILFERLIDGGSNADDVARSVAVNSAGDIAIAGFVSVTARDFRVMKLSGTTGATQWQWHVNGSTSTNDEAFSVTFDSSGQVAATGTVSSANFDLYTVKLSAAGALIWQRQWNSSFNSSDVGYDVVADSSGNVIVGGASYRGAGVMDGYVAKYSAAAGSLLWERRFNGSVSNQDVINSVDLDGLDNVVAAGFSYNATPNSDVLTAKMFASTGNLIWERRFNGSASGWDNGVAVGVSTDGNIYVAGYAGATGGTADFLVKNYQAILPTVQTPQTISFANPGGPRPAGSDLPLSASASSALPITFSVVSGPAVITEAGNAVRFTGVGTVTVRASQLGNSTWARATPVDQSFSVILSSQTITFVPPASLSASTQWPLTGQSTSGLALSYAVQSGPGSITAGVLSFSGTGTVVVRASQAGDARFSAAANVDASITVTAASTVLILDNIAENWRDRYAGSGAGVGNDIALHIDPLGDPYTAVSGIVGGYTTNAATGKDQYLAKHLANGTKEWTYVSNASGADEIMSVEVEPVSGHIFVAGYVTTGTGQDVYLAKHDGATGARMWFYTYNGGANGNDVGVSVALQGTTHVVVGGYAVGVGAGNDFFAAKLTQDNTVVWTSVQARAGTSSDVPVKVVVGTDGSVVLAGASGSDAWTVKLASAAGNRLWNQLYNYANKPDAIRGLALDAGNNVVIAAYSQGANYDMYTAKYTALDGTIIWEQRYNSSFNSSDAPWDMALDQDANVYVTGTSYRSASVRDGMTLKYSGLNGTLLWEGRFNGASAGNDENYTIAVDGIGNPVISGYTSNADATTDVYLAKHDKGPGTVRWQRTFDGANNKNDGVKKVRVDPNGNVWMAGSVTSVGGQTEVLVLRHIPSP